MRTLSENRRRWIERRARRIDVGWERCKAWFAGTGEGREHIELHLFGAGWQRLKRALRAVERFANPGFSGSVWADPGKLDSECESHDAYIDELRAGNVTAYHVNYEVSPARLTAPMLLSIKRIPPSGLSVIGFTGHDLLDPAATLRQRFEAAAVHGIDLEQWFDPCLLLIAVPWGRRGFEGRFCIPMEDSR